MKKIQTISDILIVKGKKFSLHLFNLYLMFCVFDSSDCETTNSDIPQLASFEEEENWDQISNNSDDQFDPTGK